MKNSQQIFSGSDIGEIKEKTMDLVFMYILILTAKWFADCFTIVGLPGNWYLITRFSLHVNVSPAVDPNQVQLSDKIKDQALLIRNGKCTKQIVENA